MKDKKPSKRKLKGDQGGTTSKKMKPNPTRKKNVESAQLPTPQASPPFNSQAQFNLSEDFEQLVVDTAPQESLGPSHLGQKEDEFNPYATWPKPTESKYHNPALPPLHILLQRSIEITQPARVCLGLPLIPKLQAETPKEQTLPDIWTLIPEDKLPTTTNPQDTPHPDADKSSARFTSPKSKKVTPEGKWGKVRILPSVAEKAQQKRKISDLDCPVEYRQRIGYLEAQLGKRGYDTEEAGRTAIIMRSLCISMGELHGDFARG